MAKFDPHRIENPKLIAKKIVVGDHIGEVTCFAKFGADPSMTRIQAGNENRQQTSTLDLCIDNVVSDNEFTITTTASTRMTVFTGVKLQ